MFSSNSGRPFSLVKRWEECITHCISRGFSITFRVFIKRGVLRRKDSKNNKIASRLYSEPFLIKKKCFEQPIL